LKKVLKVLAQSFALTVVAALIGLLFNLVRPAGLPLVARAAYDIYKDCPEISKEASPIKVEHLEKDLSALTIIDARPVNDFLEAHLPGARSIAYDPIRPMEESLLEELKAIGPNRILVYGDMEIDSGRLMAGELSSAGLLGVRYIQGGFEAWVKSDGATQSGGEQ
jgi:rhodanese-related sulfurtransferase